MGDCYVAAAGLPESRKDHAVVIARFGRECMAKMFSLTRRLEVTLGPDTGTLCLFRVFQNLSAYIDTPFLLYQPTLVFEWAFILGRLLQGCYVENDRDFSYLVTRW